MAGELADVVVELGVDRAVDVPDVFGALRGTTTSDRVDRAASRLPSIERVAQAIAPFAGDLAPIARDLLDPEPGGAAELLGVAARQARALALVLEAHALGAATLPEPVLRTVSEARALLPGLLRASASDSPRSLVSRPS